MFKELLFLLLAEFGFFLNLINLLPVPPLDGARVTVAMNPLIWIGGLVALLAWIVYTYAIEGRVSVFMLLLLMIAWPRVKAALAGQFRGPYYDIPLSAKWALGVAYVVLGALLFGMWRITRYQATQIMGPGWI